MISINPYTGKTVFKNEELSVKEITALINKTYNSFLSWQNISFSQRVTFVCKLSEVLSQNKKEYAKIMSLEMGKPISQGVAEIEKCAWLCEYYSKNSENHLSAKEIKTDAYKSYVRYDPIGVILGVMPWNYPFWQVIRFAVPTIMAGNTVLLKHASNVQESAKYIQKAFDKAGFPLNVFTNLSVKSNQVENIIRNPKVKGVSLTGSKQAGSAVASVAGQEIKPSLLELGGNNALVVFDDCKINQTIDTVINARFQNTGQSCIAGKRLLLHNKIAEEFIEKLKQKISKIKTGNPLEQSTYLSVLVDELAAKELKNQLDKSVEMGAEIILGGNHKKAFFQPTLVKNVTAEMPVFKEETFGPVLAITNFSTDDEAVELINQSDFGLGVSIFTQDQNRANNLIPKLNEGAVFINELVKSDPRLPFGGTKNSGYGRELSKEGILAFVNCKTVYFK